MVSPRCGHVGGDPELAPDATNSDISYSRIQNSCKLRLAGHPPGPTPARRSETVGNPRLRSCSVALATPRVLNRHRSGLGVGCSSDGCRHAPGRVTTRYGSPKSADLGDPNPRQAAGRTASALTAASAMVVKSSSVCDSSWSVSSKSLAASFKPSTKAQRFRVP